MNFFYDLPDDIQDKIYKFEHGLHLKRTFPFIQCKPNPYGTCIIHKAFFETTGYDREDLNHFNNFLDYIHGKAYNFPYEKLHENRYMMMLEFLMNYENEDI
jgi:hypothetical protein